MVAGTYERGHDHGHDHGYDHGYDRSDDRSDDRESGIEGLAAFAGTQFTPRSA
jgi:hypothetical protein